MKTTSNKNIIVLMLDTLRSDYAYNYRVSPNINYIASRGNLYRNAVAPGTWTAPSHAALFTNRKISKIKEASMNSFDASMNNSHPYKIRFLGNDAVTLANRLSEYGYYSVIFPNNPFLSKHTNLIMGFDSAYDMWLYSNSKYDGFLNSKMMPSIFDIWPPLLPKIYRMAGAMSKMMPKSLVDRSYRYIRVKVSKKVSDLNDAYSIDKGVSSTNKSISEYLKYEYNHRKQFMFVNLMEPHDGYPVSRSIVQDNWVYLSGMEELYEDITKALKAGYEKRIRYMDRKIGDTIKILKHDGILDEATLVITSDHGQFFGEHGLMYHGIFPYEEVAKIPLISANYLDGEIVGESKVIEDPVSLVSLHNSIINIASGKTDHLNGEMTSSKSVICEHTGTCIGLDETLLCEIKDRSSTARKIYDAKRYYNMPATAVYEKDMKLIHFFGARADELYNLSKDPKESTNILADNRNVAKRMLSRLGS